MESAIKKEFALRGLILGASGAIGRELVKELCKSERWQQITVIVRRELDVWKTIPGYEKLKIVKVDNLDSLEKTEQWKFDNINTLFCCLGSRTKEGEAQFIKVDYSYCLWGGQIAKANNIPHYSLVSSIGADAKSMFLYTRVKGQIEQALKNLQLPYLSVFRPGVLLHRDNDSRFIEKIASVIPFIDKVESSDLAKSLRIEAENQIEKLNQQQQQPSFSLYTNTQILQMLPKEGQKK